MIALVDATEEIMANLNRKVVSFLLKHSKAFDKSCETHFTFLHQLHIYVSEVNTYIHTKKLLW